MPMSSFSAENRNGMSTRKFGARRHREEALYSRQPTEGQAPHRLRLSTHGLPHRDRFEVFRDNFRQYLFQVDVANRAEGIFDGDIELLKAGSVGISRIVAPPSVYARTRRHSPIAEDAYTLFVGRTHGPTNEQAGISPRVPARQRLPL